MKKGDVNDLSGQIRASLDQELDFLNSQESNANAIFSRVDQPEKRKYRLTTRVLITAMLVLILMASAALAIGNWTSIAGWLGINETDRNQQPSILLAKDDYVSFELVEAVTAGENIVLAIHAVPQRNDLLLCPFAYGLVDRDVPVGHILKNMAEEYADLSIDEYATLTGKTIRWALMEFISTEEQRIMDLSMKTQNEWYLQSDGTIMIFFDIDTDLEIDELQQDNYLEMNTLFATLSNPEMKKCRSDTDRSFIRKDTVRIDWTQIPVVEPQCLALDSFVQEESSVELRDVRLYLIPYSYSLNYLYRVREDSIAALHPNVWVGPVDNIGYVRTWETKEVEMDGVKWVKCHKVFYPYDDVNIADWLVTAQYKGGYHKSEFRLE